MDVLHKFRMTDKRVKGEAFYLVEGVKSNFFMLHPIPIQCIKRRKGLHEWDSNSVL